MFVILVILILLLDATKVKVMAINFCKKRFVLILFTFGKNGQPPIITVLKCHKVHPSLFHNDIKQTFARFLNHRESILDDDFKFSDNCH